MKKSKLGVTVLASSLIFAGLTLSVVSCGDSTSTNNPQLTLTLSESTIYVGDTATITVIAEGEIIEGASFVIDEGEDVISVSSDGMVTGLAAGTATIRARAAGYSANTIDITVLEYTVDNPEEEPSAVLEWELGTFEGTFSGGPIETTDTASGGASVGYMSYENSATITFEATTEGTTTLGFVLAPAQMDSTWAIPDVVLSEVISVTLNGITLNFYSQTLTGNSSWNFFDWQEVYVDDVAISSGTNTLTIEVIGENGGPNMDCVNVYEDLGITQTISE